MADFRKPRPRPDREGPRRDRDDAPRPRSRPRGSNAAERILEVADALEEQARVLMSRVRDLQRIAETLEGGPPADELDEYVPRPRRPAPSGDRPPPRSGPGGDRPPSRSGPGGPKRGPGGPGGPKRGPGGPAGPGGPKRGPRAEEGGGEARPTRKPGGGRPGGPGGKPDWAPKPKKRRD